MAVGDKVQDVWTGYMREPLDGEAHAASRLTGKRLDVGYKLGDITRKIARNELTDAKVACPEGQNGCQMTIKGETDDSGYPSRVIYHCPVTSEVCGRLTLQAAQACETQIGVILGKADALLQAELDRLG